MKSLKDTFVESASAFPDSVALICDGQTITYSELLASAQQRALLLPALAATRPVMLLVRRDIDTIVDILALVLSGYTYVPVDAGYPPDRIDYILSLIHI